MKKYAIWLIATLLILTSCAPKPKEEVVQPKDEQNDTDKSIVPSYQLSDESYKMLLPFRPSKARGVITEQMGNRLDINEVEEGLRRHSTSVFSPDDYYFEEGQYITTQMLMEEEEGIIDAHNPDRDSRYQSEEEAEENTRFFSHVIEQNYLEKKSDNSVELKGVSLGIALKSVYRFQTEEGGPYYYQDIPFEDIQEQGTEVAQSLLEQLRQIEGLEDVDIMIALYREAEYSSPVPGHFFAKTTVEGSDMKIKDWEEINENHVLFPSEQGKEDYPEENDLLIEFGEEIDTYFPNYVGYIGEGFYENNELKKMKIEIPIEFYGESEVIGFTQYLYSLVEKMFPNNYDVEIKIQSEERMESFISKEAGSDEPVIHIFH